MYEKAIFTHEILVFVHEKVIFMYEITICIHAIMICRYENADFIPANLNFRCKIRRCRHDISPMSSTTFNGKVLNTNALNVKYGSIASTRMSLFANELC